MEAKMINHLLCAHIINETSAQGPIRKSFGTGKKTSSLLLVWLEILPQCGTNKILCCLWWQGLPVCWLKTREPSFVEYPLKRAYALTWNWLWLIFIAQHAIIFIICKPFGTILFPIPSYSSPIWSPANSHSPASSFLSYNNYLLEREKDNRCFLQDMSKQVYMYFSNCVLVILHPRAA